MLETKWCQPTMDDWQKKILTTEGNLILMCGRQVGKSEIVAKKLADYILNNPKKHIMIVSGVERQASGLYNRTLRYIEASYPNELKKGKDKPLRTCLKLKNGSILRTEPVGLDGSGARQHTLNGVVFEEMQLIPDDAFGAITPMLLTTGGFMWLLGTAWATEGYVYDRLSDPDFTVFRVNSEEIAEQRPEPMRSLMIKHLEKERDRLGEAMYGQEYLAIPSEKIRQIFPDRLISKCMILKRRGMIMQEHTHVCGVDPAGLGEDEGAITILDVERDITEQVDFFITEKLMTTQTTDKLFILDEKYDFKKIYVDDGGVGFGVFSELMNDDRTRYKTIALNNSQRSLSRGDEERRKTILKEDLYINLLRLMERGKIQLLDDPEIRESLKSCKFEYAKDTKKMLITSNYNHPVESLIRAAWDLETKDLNLKVYSIKV